MCDVPNETIVALCDLLADDSTEEVWKFWKMIKANSRFCEDYVTEIESHFKEETKRTNVLFLFDFFILYPYIKSNYFFIFLLLFGPFVHI